jgi:hypothetical protein
MQESGELSLTTDAEGRASGSVDLAALAAANRPVPYDTLSVTATWVGPTREVITQTASIT